MHPNYFNNVFFSGFIMNDLSMHIICNVYLKIHHIM